MTAWECRPVPLKFQVSDWTLFTITVPLQTRTVGFADGTPAVDRPIPPSDDPVGDSRGFFVHALPVNRALPAVSSIGKYVCYVPLQYRHSFIEFGGSFDDYQKKFSSKTRSTINRKIRKFAEHCGGAIRWETYKTPPAMREFLGLARDVSAKTYQEKLLDAGIPSGERFARRLEQLAAEDRVRGYILFDGDKPVSYLYCPVNDGVLSYAYLGYDPDYMKLSVGTILQWLALEQLFREAKFRYFDFTEGQSEQKRLFATHEVQCANVIFLRRSARNLVLVFSHLAVDRLSKWLGIALDRAGLKAGVKRMLRFAR